MSKLVELGGEDMMANQPNAAFLSWCKNDLTRAMNVIEDAQAGDKRAIKYLTFALTAGDYYSIALDILASDNSEARICAATSIGRMHLQSDQIGTTLNTLVHKLEKCDEPILCVKLFSAAFAIFEKNSEAEQAHLTKIAKLAANVLSPNLQYQAAQALGNNVANLDKVCVSALIELLESVCPEHTDIIDQIDFSLTKMVDAGLFQTALEYLEKLVVSSDGRISVKSFDSFFRKISDGKSEYLSIVALRWFAHGDFSLCSGLSQLLDEDTRIVVLSDELPKNKPDVIFMCRMVVGHFFMKPNVAASILLGVLEHSDADVESEIAQLLFDPLLLSYDGKFREYLEGVSAGSKAPLIKIIQGILDRKRAYLADFEGVEKLVELHPSQEQRQAKRARWNEEMRKSSKEAKNQSGLLSIVSKNTLLYGNSSLSFVEKEDGSYQQFDMQMQEFSTAFECPRLDIVDPVGLQNLLFNFKFRRKAKS